MGKSTQSVVQLLQRQEGVAAGWQLRKLGLTTAAIRHQSDQWRRLHRGVWLSGHAPVSSRQRWWGAAVTAPDTVLSYASAGAAGGFCADPRALVIVSRPGTGRQLHRPGLLICHSALLNDEDIISYDGLPATAPARTLIDLAAVMPENDARRATREALRVKAVTGLELEVACRRYWHRKGVARLRAFAMEYAPLAADRARSDAEVLAAASIHGAYMTPPEINVKRAGLEADLSWPDHRLIIELDGPNFHQFASEDAKRDQHWRAAGWTVIRVSTDPVYDEPMKFLAIVRDALAQTSP
jgi:hypothetical protein